MLADDAFVIYKFASVLNEFVEFANESAAQGIKSIICHIIGTSIKFWFLWTLIVS